jgi:hypothetical protein
MGQGGPMHLPGPLRAAVGLVATAADEAKHLPDRAIELPMLVVSTALQASLRAQQRYARFTARGDEVLTRRPVSDAPPEWATFDDPAPVGELARARFDDPDELTDDQARSMAQSMVGSLFGVDDPMVSPTDVASAPTAEPDGADAGFDAARRTEAARKTAAAKTTSAARRDAADRTAATPAPAAAKKTVAKKTGAKKAPTKKTATKKAAAKKAAAQKIAAKKAPAKTPAGAAEQSTKTVNKPRHTTPSAFDDVDDD